MSWSSYAEHAVDTIFKRNLGLLLAKPGYEKMFVEYNMQIVLRNDVSLKNLIENKAAILL